MAWIPLLAMSEPAEIKDSQQKQLASLEKPLYSPFIERYMLDELKQLRIDMAAQKNELLQQIIDRELTSVDRGVSYATNAITYFFYLIAGTTSILLLVGWTSIKDMKERVQLLADEKISELVNEYEQRLAVIEQQLNQKTQHIEQNREEIELTREMQSLWLRAGQDTNPANKIAIYDHILKLSDDDCEALTYKADAVLELGEPQWAANLCHQALKIDPDNGHAFYQLACAYTVMGHLEEAVHFLSEALVRVETYRDEIAKDPILLPLKDFTPFKELLRSTK
ncbi:MAG: tetratricopeptide repeat protein [Methyloprofundus sp.]|nr:tetratricopeptide repeat protein [Methyloprofundus sp.]MDT8424772.1 tetratricopeptide repeat protein [Methyloprofundus sp.]